MVGSSGTLTINGTVTIGSGGLLIDTDGKWDDLRFPASAVRVPGSGGPGASAVVGGIQALAFDADSRESVHIHAQLPHAWKKTTDLSPHIHWCTTDSSGGKVVWGIEYTIADVGDAFATPTTDIAAGTAATTVHTLTAFDDVTMTSYSGPSTMLLVRLFRDSTNSSDTHTKDAHLLEFDIHYRVNSLGSSGVASQGP